PWALHLSAAWASPGRLFASVLAGALLLRLLALWPVNFHHPDEVWQYLEPAHHLAFGRWVVAWEYRDGIRTWLIPALLALPMTLGDALAPAGPLYLLLPRLLLVLLSLSVVACATAMGLRLSRLHGAMAGFATAVWAELVYFAPRAMSEPVSLALFFPAALLLTRAPARRTPGVYLAAGLLLGLCFSARFQLRAIPACGRCCRTLRRVLRVV
ncbi:4-amino-4-deoxy-L-arabinose transferase, partial [Xanthomonas sp. Kuri4-1]